MKLALFCLGLVACAASSVPRHLCQHDTDCDPADLCIQNECTGGSAGPDAGTISPDAGTPGAAHLTLLPATATVRVQAGQAPAAQTFLLGDDGGAPLHYSLACSQGTPAPAAGNLGAGASTTISLTLPAWPAPGTQTVTCAISSDGGSQTYTLTASVSAAGAGVGPGGGTVDLLDFVMTGDTRPPSCDSISLYPQDSFKADVAAMAKLSPQFALDLGDHLFACTQSLSSARAQLKLYTDALAGFAPPWFMTMGNHECESTDCSGNPSDANFTAYSEALQLVSQKSLPYYKLDFQTRFGLARVVFLADNFADATAQAWAESTLAEADRIAKYTIVAKHHPVTGSRIGPQWSHDVVLRHKYSLILTAHAHDYSHDTSAYGGRSVVCGLGGANTSFTGFCRVQQRADGTLAFTAYDAYGNVRTEPSSTFSVAPQ
jgi:hypothetical protein